MAFDVQYKRKTEIDFISGVVSSLGKKHWNKNSFKRSHV
jgi:2-dehydropantoate 2-reductase